MAQQTIWPTTQAVQDAIEAENVSLLKTWNKTLPKPEAAHECSVMALIISALLPITNRRRKIRLLPRKCERHTAH